MPKLTIWRVFSKIVVWSQTLLPPDRPKVNLKTFLVIFAHYAMKGRENRVAPEAGSSSTLLADALLIEQ